jgi:hypothetical protein
MQWSESSPNSTSTPLRFENKNQFAPQGGNPKEFKNQQKQVRITHILFFAPAVEATGVYLLNLISHL